MWSEKLYETCWLSTRASNVCLMSSYFQLIEHFTDEPFGCKSFFRKLLILVNFKSILQISYVVKKQTNQKKQINNSVPFPQKLCS